jgi:O-antigen/teichoic acid export membrane protein
LIGRIDIKAWIENWHFGKWLLGSEILVYCSSLPMYMFLVAWFVNAAASGQLSAAQKLFGPARIISYYLATVLPIQFAQQLSEGGNDALRRGMRNSSLRVLPVVGIFCFLIALFARPLLSIFGRDFAAEPGVLAMYALVAFLAYIQMVLSAALTAKRATRVIFIGTLGGAVVSLAVSVVLIKLMGTYGALLGMMLTALVIAALLWRGYFASLTTPTPTASESDSAEQPAAEVIDSGLPVMVKED